MEYEISRNCKNFQLGMFQKFSIWKIPKIVFFENSENFQLGKILKICNFENSENFQLRQFQKFVI